MNIRFIRLTMLISLAIITVCLSFNYANADASSEEIDFMHPLEGVMTLSDQGSPENSKLKTQAQNFVKRRGGVSVSASNISRFKIMPEVNLAWPAGTVDPLVGKDIKLDFFDNTSFIVKVETVSRPSQDVVSIIGRVHSEEISTFTLTITNEGYAISLDNIKENLRYIVTGDPSSGNGTVEEINLYELPHIHDLPAISPPSSNTAPEN